MADAFTHGMLAIFLTMIGRPFMLHLLDAPLIAGSVSVLLSLEG